MPITRRNFLTVGTVAVAQSVAAPPSTPENLRPSIPDNLLEADRELSRRNIREAAKILFDADESLNNALNVSPASTCFASYMKSPETFYREAIGDARKRYVEAKENLTQQLSDYLNQYDPITYSDLRTSGSLSGYQIVTRYGDRLITDPADIQILVSPERVNDAPKIAALLDQIGMMRDQAAKRLVERDGIGYVEADSIVAQAFAKLGEQIKGTEGKALHTLQEIQQFVDRIQSDGTQLVANQAKESAQGVLSQQKTQHKTWEEVVKKSQSRFGDTVRYDGSDSCFLELAHNPEDAQKYLDKINAILKLVAATENTGSPEIAPNIKRRIQSTETSPVSVQLRQSGHADQNFSGGTYDVMVYGIDIPVDVLRKIEKFGNDYPALMQDIKVTGVVPRQSFCNR